MAHPPAPTNEELARRAQQGDREALDLLCRRNAGLVWQIARRHYRDGAGLDLEDLAQEGTLGFLAAVRKWDPARGARLSTLAHWWITQAVSRAARQATLIHIPEHAYLQPPAEALPAVVASLDAEDGFDAGRRAERLPDPLDLEAVVLEGVFVTQALAALPDRERQVLAMRFGLLGEEEATLQQIAHALRYSREGVRLVERRALAHLRKAAAG